MKQEFILLPVLAMVLLTVIVSARLYLTRVGEMRARHIRPQEVKTRVAGAVLQDTAASDNFMNLFELPVLFYALVILVYVMGLTDSFYVVLAWLFVALRYVHSWIHVTYNRVMHRLKVYALASLALWIMWGRFAFQLIERLQS